MAKERTLNHLSLGYVESLYAEYLHDAASSPPEWQQYFSGLTNGEVAGN